MTIPKISMPCFLAQLNKSTQQDPDVFAVEFMMRLTKEQPEMLACIISLVQPMIDFGEVEQVDAVMAKEHCLLGIFCTLGVVMEAISATIDAEEMNEVWK